MVQPLQPYSTTLWKAEHEVVCHKSTQLPHLKLKLLAQKNVSNQK